MFIVNIFFKLINYFLLKLNSVNVGNNTSIKGIIVVKNRGIFSIGDNLKINSSRFKNVIGGDTRCSFVINDKAKIIIENDVKISNSAFYSNASITIRDNVMIGGGCRFWDSDFHPIDPEVRKKTPNENFKSKPILLKKNAFIGGGSIILKGVTIGENSVVGAGSVVSKSIPDNEIWGGNPAQFIRKI